jgi:hypothetical protein
MRRIATMLALTVASAVSACGQYTNFPARIKISGESNLVGEVSYQFDQSTSGVKVTATTKNPKLILIGEAGSVGATFDTMNITYQGVPDNFGSKSVNLKAGLRVDSSHNFERTVAADKTTVTKVIQGKGQMDLPIVSAEVVRVGNPFNNSGGYISAPISAVVTLQGIDDAGFPIDLQFGVPINFIRPGN